MNLAKISDDNQRVKGEKTFWDQAIINPQQNGIITMVPWSPRAIYQRRPANKIITTLNLKTP